jgi:putative NADH-flavin reductase
MKVFVAGPTGTTGREVVKEFLDRGHFVTGFSKNPGKWGTHENYTPVSGTVLDDLPALVRVCGSLSVLYCEDALTSV